ESSARDSSFESSVRPSRKRCRSPAATRFRDSVSPKDSVEEDIDTDVFEDIEADATIVKVAVDRNVEAGMLMPDAVEHLEQERASLLEQVASLERSNARLQDTMMMEIAKVD
nr:hypothetical protein [Tanacetum cinerariifolium]